MARILVTVLILIVSDTSLSADQSQTTKGTDTAQLELYLVELEAIDGITNPKGFEYAETGSLAYYHAKPSLVVTPADVDRVVVRRHSVSIRRRTPGFSMEVHLTDEARKKIAEKATSGDGIRLMAVFFGKTKSRGVKRYEIKNTRGVPDDCQAKSFVANLDFNFADVRIQDVIAAVIGG